MKAIEYREWNDLSTVEQEAAINHFLLSELTTACEMPSYYQYDEDLYKKIIKAGKKADKNQTPWFTREFIMDECGEEFRELALLEAQDALYEPCDQSFTIASYYELEKSMNKEN